MADEKAPDMVAAEAEGKEMLAMLTHAVGWPRLQRNGYCANATGDDALMWWTMVGLGLAKPGLLINDGRDRYFTVTPAGVAMLRQHHEAARP